LLIKLIFQQKINAKYGVRLFLNLNTGLSRSALRATTLSIASDREGKFDDLAAFSLSIRRMESAPAKRRAGEACIVRNSYYCALEVRLKENHYKFGIPKLMP
jgi:hypothetical protein